MKFMPDDWVLYEGHPCTIYAAYKDGYCLNYKNPITFHPEYEIEPMPFTRELLERNGYKEIYGTGIFESKNGPRIKIASFINDGWDSDLMINYIEAKYVHQVQQYLRLRRDDNTFANNFKVK